MRHRDSSFYWTALALRKARAGAGSLSYVNAGEAYAVAFRAVRQALPPDSYEALCMPTGVS